LGEKSVYEPNFVHIFRDFQFDILVHVLLIFKHPHLQTKLSQNFSPAHFWRLFQIFWKTTVYEPNFADFLRFLSDFPFDILVHVLMIFRNHFTEQLKQLLRYMFFFGGLFPRKICPLCSV